MAINQNFVLRQGADFIFEFRVKLENRQPENLTGYSAVMQCRPEPGSATLHFECSTANGRIEQLGASGVILGKLPGADSVALDFEEAGYDLYLVGPGLNGERLRLAEGLVTFSKSHTVIA